MSLAVEFEKLLRNAAREEATRAVQEATAKHQQSLLNAEEALRRSCLQACSKPLADQAEKWERALTTFESDLERKLQSFSRTAEFDQAVRKALQGVLATGAADTAINKIAQTVAQRVVATAAREQREERKSLLRRVFTSLW